MRNRFNEYISAPFYSWSATQHQLTQLSSGIDQSNAFSIGDVEALLKRARGRKLKSWGLAEQRLPTLR
jgi:hypothetical protein